MADRIVPTPKPYEKNILKNVMMPAMAVAKHKFVEQRLIDMTAFAETSNLNVVEDNKSKIGVITSGSSYPYAKEALGNNVRYLKLGMAFPMPVKLIEDFAQECDQVFVMEELDDFIETHCKKHGIDVMGKEIFSFCGEYSQSIIKEKILGITTESYQLDEVIPGRPPVMCAGCPHRGVFYALKKLGVYVSGDIGCYTLGAAAPLQAIDTCVCMGGSIPGAHGYNKGIGVEKGKAAVAVIGDSTFIHSGVTGLINIAYNKGNAVTIIMDNSITGMTGHQQNPTTGYTIKGDPTSAVDLEALVKAIGIKRLSVVDPYDIDATYAAIKAEIAEEEPSVIISRCPCALLKTVKHKAPLVIDNEKCIKCKACLKIGCPAISIRNDKMMIDATQCVGCGQCVSMCKFGAIQTSEVK